MGWSNKNVFFFFRPPFSFQPESKGGGLNPCHGWRAGEQRSRTRSRSRRSGQRGLAEALCRSGDAAAEVPPAGRENPRAAGRKGETVRKGCTWNWISLFQNITQQGAIILEYGQKFGDVALATDSIYRYNETLWLKKSEIQRPTSIHWFCIMVDSVCSLVTINNFVSPFYTS